MSSAYCLFPLFLFSPVFSTYSSTSSTNTIYESSDPKGEMLHSVDYFHLALPHESLSQLFFHPHLFPFSAFLFASQLDEKKLQVENMLFAIDFANSLKFSQNEHPFGCEPVCMLITGEVFVTVAGLSVMIATHINPVLFQYSIAVSQDAYWHTGIHILALVYQMN